MGDRQQAPPQPSATWRSRRTNAAPNERLLWQPERTELARGFVVRRLAAAARQHSGRLGGYCGVTEGGAAEALSTAVNLFSQVTFPTTFRYFLL